MRVSVPLVVVLVVLGGSASAVGAPPTSSGGFAPLLAPDDPGTDVLGWEAGYWHNESVAIDSTDGLNESELDAVIARTMARVERIRRLEFENRVSAEVVSRAEFRATRRNRTVSTSLRRFDNAKFEALFLINESTDSIAVQRRNGGNATLGYYDPDRDAIVLVAGEGGNPRIDERTLAHELVHALQDQHFGLGRFDARTRDARNAQDALIEGDARLVEYRYRTRCGERWACVTADDSTGDLANYGVYLLTYFPYSDGPAFVRTVYREGGWPAVNSLYETPPASSEQVIHPEKYDSDAPVELPEVSIVLTPPPPSTPTVPDPTDTPTTSTNESGTNATASAEETTPGGKRTRSGNGTATRTTHTTTPTAGNASRTNSTRGPTPTSSPNTTRPTRTGKPTPTDVVTSTPHVTATPVPPPTPRSNTWRRVRPPDRPDHATLGEAAIAVMFFYPTYHSGGDDAIVSARSFFNFQGDDLSRFDPYEYAQSYSSGWDGDRLQVYENEANQTGYVWRIAWDSPADAREFAAGYRRLLAYWGGYRVGPKTYRIRESGFADAFYVDVQGDVVTIVNAPGLEALSTLYGINVVRAPSRATLTVGNANDDPTPISTFQPGFGPLPALVALSLVVVLLLSRERRAG